MSVNHFAVYVKTTVGWIEVKKAPSNVTLRQVFINAQLAFATHAYAARFDIIDLKLWLDICPIVIKEDLPVCQLSH